MSTEGHEKLHLYFGLSYANYLTIPRSILQSMPDEWQGQLADLLNELEETARRHGVEWPENNKRIEVLFYRVLLRKGETRAEDPLADYQRGRRRLWFNEARPATKEGSVTQP